MATIFIEILVIEKKVLKAEPPKELLRIVPEGEYSIKKFLSITDPKYQGNTILAVRNTKNRMVFATSYERLVNYKDEDLIVVITQFSYL